MAPFAQLEVQVSPQGVLPSPLNHAGESSSSSTATSSEDEDEDDDSQKVPQCLG